MKPICNSIFSRQHFSTANGESNEYKNKITNDEHEDDGPAANESADDTKPTAAATNELAIPTDGPAQPTTANKPETAVGSTAVDEPVQP